MNVLNMVVLYMLAIMYSMVSLMSFIRVSPYLLRPN